jgi:cobalt/nickel transport system permease protein
MRRQKTESRTQKTEGRKQKNNHRIQIVLVCILFSVFCSLAAFGSEKWPGVDEAVVGKFAEEYGREAKDPLINTDQGNLLLFVFLLAGAVGGFAAGYYWKELTVKGQQYGCREKQKIKS